MTGPYAILRNRDFVFYLTRALSSRRLVSKCSKWRWAGRFMNEPHSLLALGLVTDRQFFLPMVLMTLPAGHVADTRERKKSHRGDASRARNGVSRSRGNFVAAGSGCMDLYLFVYIRCSANVSVGRECIVSTAIGGAKRVSTGGNLVVEHLPNLGDRWPGGGWRLDCTDSQWPPQRLDCICHQCCGSVALPDFDWSGRNS